MVVGFQVLIIVWGWYNTTVDAVLVLRLDVGDFGVCVVLGLVVLWVG